LYPRRELEREGVTKHLLFLGGGEKGELRGPRSMPGKIRMGREGTMISDTWRLGGGIENEYGVVQ